MKPSTPRQHERIKELGITLVNMKAYTMEELAEFIREEERERGIVPPPRIKTVNENALAIASDWED